MKNPIILLLTLLLFPFSIHAQQFTSTYTGIREIRMITGSADCEISQVQGGSVRLKLDHDMGEGYEPGIKSVDGRLMIVEEGPRIRHKKWTLEIPADMDVDYTSGSGDLTINGLKLGLVSVSGSGNVILEDVEGDLNITAGSGDLKANGFRGNIRANTGSGDISMNKVQGGLKINTGSGDIELSASQIEVHANAGSGNVRGTDITLAGNAEMNAGSGNVLLSLGNTPRYGITLNSGSGNAVLDRNGADLNAEIEMRAIAGKGRISAPFSIDREEKVKDGKQTILKKYATTGSGERIEIKIGTGSGQAVIR